MASSTAKCRCCKIHDDCCICLFDQGRFSYSKSLKNIPEFVPETLPEWLNKASKDSCKKSWKFYKERYVHDVVVARNAKSKKNTSTTTSSTSTTSSSRPTTEISSSEYVIRARCYHSMSKRQPAHFVWIQGISHNNRARVLSAHCSCKAGAGGICNHTYAVLYQMLDYCSDDLREIPADACTSRAQEWHVPRTGVVESLPVMGTHFAKPETDRERQRKKLPVYCKLYDPRRPFMKAAQSDQLAYYVERLRDMDDKPPFSYLLAADASRNVNTALGNVPLGSCLSYQLSDFGRPKVRFWFSRELQMRGVDSVPCKGFPDLPVSNGELYSCENIDQEWLDTINIDTPFDLEQITVQQNLSTEWHKARRLRLTASNFGKVNNRVAEPTEPFLKSIFHPNNLSHITSIRHGQINENLAKDVYVRECSKRVKNFRIFDSGLVVGQDLVHLGATPDAKVYDPSSNSPLGLLEVKCPLLNKAETLEAAAESHKFYVEEKDGGFSLKRRHPHGYFEQIQGQLALSGLPWCDFVVYLSDSREMAVIRVDFDKVYWNSLLVKLNDFYSKCIPYLKGK